MSLSSSQISFNAQWTQSKDNAPFDATTQSDSVALAVQPDTSVLNRVFLGSATLAANANTTFDLYSFTDLAGNVTLATKARGLAIEATGSGGIMKLETGVTNGATWFLSGTGPAITLNCGTDGCGICLYDGVSFTLSNTVKNMKLSNTGNASLDLKFYALLGT